jgi:hypothetical protein
MKSNKVGGDIDAWCTRCKMELGHTVLAMVGSRPARVRCNTCQGEHNYRGTSAPTPRRASGASSAREKPKVTSWEALLAQKDVSRARKYSAREKFEPEELLSHPVFGIGLVQEVRGDKIQVAFKADVKTLVHGKS